jgi:hypothetical protein
MSVTIESTSTSTQSLDGRVIILGKLTLIGQGSPYVRVHMTDEDGQLVTIPNGNGGLTIHILVPLAYNAHLYACLSREVVLEGHFAEDNVVIIDRQPHRRTVWDASHPKGTTTFNRVGLAGVVADFSLYTDQNDMLLMIEIMHLVKGKPTFSRFSGNRLDLGGRPELRDHLRIGATVGVVATPCSPGRWALRDADDLIVLPESLPAFAGLL